MYTLLNRIKNSAFRGAMRLCMPDLARQMEQEGVFTVDVEVPASPVETDFMRVEDRGADITIFAFSGLDVLYAGLARFEFQKVLHSLNLDANFVFIRDIHRKGFCLKPDGSQGGAEFYEAQIRSVMRRLGATHNIAIGSSIGGSAAFYFGARCEMQQIIIFGAAFTLDAFGEPRVIAKTIFDLRKLFREPGAYVELLIVMLSAIWGKREIVRQMGKENVPRPLELYRALRVRPPVTLFYGETAWPDARQAHMLAEIPEARVVPLPTGRHNTPAFLKQRGLLTEYLRDAIIQVPRLAAAS